MDKTRYKGDRHNACCGYASVLRNSFIRDCNGGMTDGNDS